MKKEKKNRFDLMDALSFAGLGVFSLGLWWISPAYSLMATGGVIFLIGLMGSRS